VKRAVFPMFCGGESLEDCKLVADQMRLQGVKLMVDQSLEECEDREAWAVNLRNKKALLQNCRNVLKDDVTFVSVKPTALMSPGLLEEMCDIICRDEHHLDKIVDPRPGLSAESLELLDEAISNFRELCRTAEKLQLPVLLDAEQSHRQLAMDFISLEVMAEFNRPGKPAIFYNTYQAYMLGTKRRIARDLRFATERGFLLAAKVVRGAYIVFETERSKEMGTPYPLHSTKAETDLEYDASIEILLRGIPLERCSVVIATHNKNSVERAIAIMHELGIANNHPRVYFGQIKGISEHLTLALGQAGFNSRQLTLFGDFWNIFPWMLRRLDENRDLLGANQQSRQFLVNEVFRRLNIFGK